MAHVSFEAHRDTDHYVSIETVDGPVRVVTNQPDPEFVRRPVGFTADLEPKGEA